MIFFQRKFQFLGRETKTNQRGYVSKTGKVFKKKPGRPRLVTRLKEELPTSVSARNPTIVDMKNLKCVLNRTRTTPLPCAPA